jgi:uncharacterized protein YcbK (DUF882 family)
MSDAASPLIGRIGRRRLLLGSAALCASSHRAWAESVDQPHGYRQEAEPQATRSFWERPRWVWLRRAVTGEQLRVVYWRDGRLLEEPYRQICWLLRDVRFERMVRSGHPMIKRALDAGVVRPGELHVAVEMAPHAIDLLYAYSAWLAAYGVQRPLEITSGFRHVVTNDYMTEGAVRGSFHVQGKAVDLALPGVDVARLGSFGQWLRGGGVGIYQTQNFIHLDVGRVRSWVG